MRWASQVICVLEDASPGSWPTLVLYSLLAQGLFTLSLPSYAGQLDRSTYDAIPSQVTHVMSCHVMSSWLMSRHHVRWSSGTGNCLTWSCITATACSGDHWAVCTLWPLGCSLFLKSHLFFIGIKLRLSFTDRRWNILDLRFFYKVKRSPRSRVFGVIGHFQYWLIDFYQFFPCCRHPSS